MDDGLIPLIFRGNHPPGSREEEGGILNPDKWENDPRRVSRCHVGTRFFRVAERGPVNKFVFTMSDQSAGYFCLRLSRPTTPSLHHPCVERINIEVEREEGGGWLVLPVLTNLCVPRNLEPRVPRIRTV